MSAPSPRRPAGRSTLVRLLLATLLALPLGLYLPDAPRAHAVTAPLGLTVDSVTVTGNTPGTPVLITGTVTNSGPAPAYSVAVSLWRSTATLRSVRAVQDALTADAAPTGAVLNDTTSESFVVTGPTAALAPGASASFTVSGTLAELGLGTNASYWVGARVTAATAPGRPVDPALQAQAQSLATVPGADAPAVVGIVALDATPARLEPGLFANDALAAQLATGGRLNALLVAAATRSWVVDPELLAEVADMADGYRVVSAGDTTAPGTGADAAAAWLATYRTLPAAGGVQALYARPDLVGAAASGSSGVLKRALDATSAAKLNLPKVVLAERVSPESLTAAADQGLPVLSAAPGPASPWVRMGDARVAGVLDLDAPTRSPMLGTSPPARRAAALALARATGLQVRLIRTAEAVAIDAAATPSWVVSRTLPDLLAGAPTATAATPSPRSANGELNAVDATRLDTLQQNLTAYVAAAPKAAAAGQVTELVAAAASEAWLDDPSGRAAFVAGVADVTGASAMADGVALSVAGNVTLASSTSQFPATITNNLPDAITVRVGGKSDNSARLQVDPSDWVTVAPRDSYTVHLTASAQGNGVLGVHLYVEAPDGTRVSSPRTVTVEATNLGFVGWVIVGVSGVVLVVTSALRIRQVRRRRSGT